jgi:lysophosphatidylcholine acyltransferase/lyso-PAF acetyltransferase
VLGKLASRACLLALGFVSVRAVAVDYAPGTGPAPATRPKGKAPPPPAAGGVVANHVGYTDVLALMVTHFPAFVARGATKDLPLIGTIRCGKGGVGTGWIGPRLETGRSPTPAPPSHHPPTPLPPHSNSDAMGCLYVNRDKAAGAAGVAAAVADRARAAAAGAARPLLLFPEGTTTNGRFLLPFKTGAFVAGAPVAPVVLAYGRTRVNPAWETVSGARHVFLMLCQPTHSVTVYTLPVYVPSEAEKANPSLYAANVRRALLAVGDFSPLDATLADKWEYQALLRGETPEAAAAAGAAGGASPPRGKAAARRGGARAVKAKAG